MALLAGGSWLRSPRMNDSVGGKKQRGELTVAMTKADIVEALYEKVGFSKKEAADLVELVFDQIKGTLSQGQKIKISGFGNFVVREKRSRVGRNPQTGESIEISARRVLTLDRKSTRLN